jgi:UDP-N-acetylmuramyl pentapeptide synthase
VSASLRPLRERELVRLGGAWRRHGLRRTLVVGVTGSCGKTTTKDLAAAVLGSRLHGTKSPDRGNTPTGAARTLLRTPPWSGYVVVELGAWGPGTLRRGVALLRPSVAVVTNVGPDHKSAFRSLDATAAEKALLVAAVPVGGVAVLNADDPRVLAMRDRAAGRVITFGLASAADVRASDVAGAWPERLSFTVHHGDHSVRAATRLCGPHWVSSALAAVAVGLGAGIRLAEAARALASVEPWAGRMSPHESPGGVTFVRDDWKAPLWSVGPALTFLREARARRKVAVLGTLSDFSGSSEKYPRVGREALDVADHVVFVGENAHRALPARSHPRGDRLRTFATLQAAHRYLTALLEPGDLVLLKGSVEADHLGRLALARSGGVACWRPRCGRRQLCETCALLHVPSTPAFGARGADAGAA